MFTSTGLFRDVPCPKGTDCKLTNCIFSHEAQAVITDTNGSKVYDPFEVVPDVSSPPAKRRRLEPPEATSTPPATSARLNPQTTLRVPRAAELKAMIQNGRSSMASEEVNIKDDVPKAPAQNGTASPKPSILVKTTTRPVSPPPLSVKKVPTTEATSRSSTPGPATKESLIPRQVAKPPAQHAVRNQSLQMLFAAMLDLNKQAARGPGKSRGLSLKPDELTKLALDEEEYNALTCEGEVYRQVMGRRIKALKTMQVPEWLAFLTDKFKKSYGAVAATTPIPKPPSKIGTERKFFSSGLPSAHEEVIILRRLRTPLEGLEPFGYVTSPPTEDEIKSAKKTSIATAGYEKCDRCETRFQVFPGRNDAGQLTSGGECQHHWGRINRPPRGQSGAVTGQPEAYWNCCNAALGTIGCTTAPTHVFNVKDDAARLASILQFESTPRSDDKKKKSPITFDCEMAYTTLGLELIRLTAVTWPAGDEAIDVLVRPYGEILDLNTRFSGVSRAQWADAIASANDTNANMDRDVDSGSEDGELPAPPTPAPSDPPRLRMVPSVSAARALLTSYLTPSTPLLGHAISNDLNACRLVHPFIIDTCLLYPHPKGLPLRYGLRMLTGKYLSRAIQQGGEDGHDSKEDAVATGDLVKVKVAEEWQKLRAGGWKFVDAALVEPATEETGLDGARKE